MKRLIQALLIIFAIVLSGTAAFADKPHFPVPVGHVNDYAHLLPDQTRQALEQSLTQYNKDTSIEIAVVIIPTLNGQTTHDVCDQIWSEWHIGKKGEDNGVLVLVAAPPESKTRIQTGYGIQPYLTDVECKRIVEDIVHKLNREGKNAESVVAAVDAIRSKLGNTPWAERKAKKASDDNTLLWILLIIAGIIFLLWIFWPRRGYGGYGGGGSYSGGSSWSSGDSGGGGGFGFGGGDSGGGGGGD